MFHGLEQVSLRITLGCPLFFWSFIIIIIFFFFIFFIFFFIFFPEQAYL